MYSNFLKLLSCHFHTASRIATIPLKKTGDEVIVRGWVQKIRKLKKNIFLDINDGSSCQDLQIVISKSLIEQELSNQQQIGIGDSLEINGILGKSPQGQNEIQANQVNIIGEGRITQGYPFTPKQNHPPEYVREYLHFRSRISYINSLLRIRHNATKIIHDFFDSNDFVNIHTPILTENDCEGAGEVFIVRPDNLNLLKEMSKPNITLENSFFDKKVYLSVSGQLSLEAMTHGLGNTYTLGPTFRAENSRSLHHLSEFYMLEAELAFIKNIKELTRFIEKMIKTITENIINNCEKDLENCQKKLDIKQNYEWLNKNWETITFDDAYKILKEKISNELQTKINQNEGFSKEQELILVKYFNSPVFVINWPKAIKPFYMKTMENDESKVHAVDLLVPNVGELIGGSLRENNYERLKTVTPNGLEWYLELRKFGSIPTGGFGMGFERYLQLISGIRNIRDVIPFPRYPHNCRM